MNVKQRALILGAVLGMLAGGSVLAGANLLGSIAGQAGGMLLAALFGTLGAWVASGMVAQSVADALDLKGKPTASAIGWEGLDTRLEASRRSLGLAARAREELEGLERLARALRGSNNDFGSKSSVPPKGNGSSMFNGSAKRGVSPLEEIREAVSQIAIAVENLGGTADRMASGASDATETVGRTTSTVEAISDRIDRISQSAEQAAEATERARHEARRGLDQIQGIIEGMDRLRTRVEANAKKARRLGDRSMEINAIVELIGGLSSRTDMLALNATIESVRAGEHGRGFAVVAEEIRKLAERAAAATREIGTLVEAIQADAHESIRALGEEQAEMEQEAKAVQEAGAALQRISQVAEDSARVVENISLSANDQVMAAQDLVHAMQRISDVSRLIHKESSQVRKDVQSLAQRCRSLSEAPRGEAVKELEESSNGPLKQLAAASRGYRQPALEATP